MGVNDFRFWVVTWTPQVCRIIAFYLLLGHILPTFGGLGRRFRIGGLRFWVWGSGV